MSGFQSLHAQGGGGAHSFGDRADLTEPIQNDAVSVCQSHSREPPRIVAEFFAAFSRFEHNVNHCVVRVVFEKRPGVAPLGHDAQLRIVFEVGRLLRPGGVFAFNIASPLIWLCWGDGEEPPGPELVRSYFGLRRETWETVEFQLPYGEWIRLFRSNGFEVLDLVELRPPARPRTTYPDFAPLGWARRWPGENIWKLRKRG